MPTMIKTATAGSDMSTGEGWQTLIIAPASHSPTAPILHLRCRHRLTFLRPSASSSSRQLLRRGILLASLMADSVIPNFALKAFGLVTLSKSSRKAFDIFDERKKVG